MNRIHSALISSVLLSTLAGCGTGETQEVEDGTPVTLAWSKGDTFHLAAAYRRTAVKTEGSTVDFQAAMSGSAIPNFEESWTDDVVWMGEEHQTLCTGTRR